MRRNRRQEHACRRSLCFKIFVNDGTAHGMADDHRQAGESGRNLGNVLGIVSKARPSEFIMSFAFAVTAKTDCVAGKTLLSKIIQEIFIPAPRSVTGAVYEEQRCPACVLRGEFRNDFQMHVTSPLFSQPDGRVPAAVQNERRIPPRTDRKIEGGDVYYPSIRNAIHCREVAASYRKHLIFEYFFLLSKSRIACYFLDMRSLFCIIAVYFYLSGIPVRTPRQAISCGLTPRATQFWPTIHMLLL